jgi:hypothetical protein
LCDDGVVAMAFSHRDVFFAGEAMTTPETAVKKRIVAYLDSVPGLWHVAFHNTGYTRKGIPDRLCCYRGRFVALEVKASAVGKPTAYQAREIAAIQKAGGVAAVVCCVEQVATIFDDLRVELNGGP